MIWTYVLIGLAAFVLLLLFSFLRATAKVPTYQTSELLAGLKSEVKAMIDVAKKDFAPLSVAELSARPTENSWSVGECLQHLNLYGDYYLPAIKVALEAEGQPQPTFKGSALGDYFANSMRPREEDGQPKSKMPTFKDKNPTLLKMEVSETIVADFMAQQYLFLDYLTAAESKNISRPKIKITISRLIRLSLGDTFRFNIYHNMRHVQQAIRALRKIKPIIVKGKMLPPTIVKATISETAEGTLAKLEKMRKKVEEHEQANGHINMDSEKNASPDADKTENKTDNKGE